MSEAVDREGAEQSPAEERHASWIELFFDLVVVAGISELGHLLHGEPQFADVGMYALVYFAFWIAWACFMMYGNITADNTRTRTMLLGMVGMAVMTAAVPGIREGHANAFALGYIFVRVLASRVWSRGQVVIDWPLAQMATGIIPWIAAMWADEPVKYWLWALGLLLDMGIMFSVSGTTLVNRMQERIDRLVRRRPSSPDGGRGGGLAGRGGRGRGGGRDGQAGNPPTVSAAHSDSAHLSERLGLYIIIVLGEGVIQVISNASEASWNAGLVRLAAGAFLLLVGLWALSLLYGHAGIPHLVPSRLPVRISMALHCFITGAVAVLAAGLGSAIEHSGGVLPGGVLWLICAGTSVYFGISVIAGLIAKTGRMWLLGWGLPCTLAPLLLAILGAGRVSTSLAVWLIVVVVYWQVFYEWRQSRKGAAEAVATTP